MPNIIIINFPLPPRVLHHNGRTKRYGYLASVVKKARHDAGWIAKPHAPSEPWTRATFHATFYFTAKRKRDDDGLLDWVKPYRDALQDAGIIADDNGFTVLAPSVVVGKHQSPRVVLRIERTE
jgi:Holliday junction resolvase RusA-like endonuclease